MKNGDYPHFPSLTPNSGAVISFLFSSENLNVMEKENTDIIMADIKEIFKKIHDNIDRIKNIIKKYKNVKD